MSEVKISASDVKKLRDRTGSGMMDCKKALKEAEGDFDKAVEILRKKGQKISAKRAERETKEGVVIALVTDDEKKGVIVKLGCETDFVAKNDEFVDMTKKMAGIALEHFPSSREELLGLQYNDDLTIEEKVTEQVGVIGEKIELSDYEYLQSEMVVPYVHMGYKAGVIVGLNKSGDEAREAGRDVAMQTAAMRPIALSKEDVDSTTVEKEMEIGREQAQAEGKPDHILDRIAEGKLNKFFKENTLLAQDFVKDSKKSVEEYVKSVDPELEITGFRHVELG